MIRRTFPLLALLMLRSLFGNETVPFTGKPEVPSDILVKEDPDGGEPVIKVSGTHSLSKERIESLVYDCSSWLNWLQAGRSHNDVSLLLKSLENELHLAFLGQGFPDASIRVSDLSSSEEFGVHLQIQEGKGSKFLGFETSPDLPPWLRNWSQALLGIHEESVDLSLKTVSLWRCQTTGIFDTHPGDLAFANHAGDQAFANLASVMGNPSGFFGLEERESVARSWFGDTDLLSPSEQIVPSSFPGFFPDRAILAKMRLLQTLRYLKNHPEDSISYPLAMLKRKDDLQLLLGCEGARRGYPSIQATFVPMKRKGGYVIRLEVSNFNTALTFAGLQVVGAKKHSSKQIQKWLMEENSLRKGQILTTNDLIAIRRRLLESCSFHDVGVRPLNLSGPSELLVTLKDHSKLPRLGEEFSPKKEMIRKFSNLLYGKPRMMVEYMEKSIQVRLKTDFKRSLFLLQFLNEESKLLATIYLLDGYLGLSLGDDPLPVGKLALNVSFHLMAGGTFSFDKGKDRNISMAAGFRTDRKPSMLLSHWTPALLLYDFGRGWANEFKRTSDGWTYSKDGLVLNIREDQEMGLQAEVENSPFDARESSLKLTVLEDLALPLPDDAFLLDCPTLSSDEFLNFLHEATREEWTATPSSNEQNATLAMIAFEKILLPKFYRLASSLLEEEAHIPASGTLPSTLEGILGWKEREWPLLFVESASAAFSKDVDKLIGSLNQALNSDQSGPLGNLAFAALCKKFVSPSLGDNFLLKARMGNTARDFSSDLQCLNLIDGLVDFLIEVKGGSKLREELLEWGVDHGKLELCLRGIPDDPADLSMERKLILTEGFLAASWEKAIGPIFDRMIGILSED